MQSNDRVVVVGDDVSPEPAAAPERGRGRQLIGLVGALALALGAFALLQNAPSPGAELDGGALVAPDNPAPAPGTPVATVPTISAIATGWARLDLPGTGPIVSLDHGDGGWMALAAGEIPQVLLSTDARVWLARSFPGPLDGLIRTSISRDRLVVVESNTWNGAGARSWVSTDDGETWRTALVSNPWAMVSAVADTGGGLMAAGFVADGPTDMFDVGGPTEATVWRYTADSWTPVEFAEPPGRSSRVGAIVEHDGAVFAFGRANGQPVAWRLDGTRFVPEPITMPRQVGGWSFLALTPAVDGWWLAELGSGPSLAYARSTDLHSWEMIDSGLFVSWNTSSAATSLGIVQVGDDDQTYRLIRPDGVETVRFRYPGTATGFEADRRTTVVASDGDRVVMGGGADSPVVWVRGADGGGVGVIAPPSRAPRWQSVQSFGLGSWDSPYPFEVLGVGDGFVVSTPQGVWRTEDPINTRAVGDLDFTGHLIGTEFGVFLATDSGLYRRAGDSWAKVDLPIDFPVGLAATPEGLIAVGWDETGQPVVVGSTGDTWEVVVQNPDSTVVPAGVFGDLIFGFDPTSDSPSDMFVSADGKTWTAAGFGDAITGVGGSDSGEAFFVTGRSDRSTTIELVEGGITLDVPSIDPRELITVGSVVRVRGSDGIWQSEDSGATWASLPFGLEYGLTGSVRLVPTERPVLLMADRDAYRFLTLPS
jgi:hypothetical protein